MYIYVMNLVKHQADRIGETKARTEHTEQNAEQNRMRIQKINNEIKKKKYYAIINRSNKCNDCKEKSKNEMAIFAMHTFKRGDHVTSQFDAILVLIKWILHRKPSFQRYNFI